jgi:predicted transcriptional regulator
VAPHSQFKTLGEVVANALPLCLRWLKQDRSLEEIARIQGRSVMEIERCLEEALVLLGVDSIEEAIRKIRSDRFQ